MRLLPVKPMDEDQKFILQLAIYNKYFQRTFANPCMM